MNFGEKTRAVAPSALILIIGIVWLFVGSTLRADAADDSFRLVKGRLLGEGYSSLQVESLFASRPSPVYKLVASTFHIQESKLNYDQFLEPGPIARARRFLQQNATTLGRAERAYGVDPPVIAAILLVETGFGSQTGHTPAVPVFCTFALMEMPSHRNRVWAMVSAKDKKRWSRDTFDERLMRRSEWAYEELRALIRLADSAGLDAGSLRGSYMGAIGWPQFLPSNIVKYGADGNQDGRIDLYDSQDAIFSIANYLRGYGWCTARTRGDQEEVIYHYNKSRPYVRTVLDVAARLNGS